MPSGASLILTCEHAGNRVPRSYESLFEGHEELLNSHRGYDLGAHEVARHLSRTLAAPLFEVTVTRLLVDLNRSAGHPRLFSEVTRHLPAADRERILSRHYWPHRGRVLAAIDRELAAGRTVFHLAVHSFTPVLDGVTRQVDLGLLYDPGRKQELECAIRWASILESKAPGLRVRRNQPYRGVADGLTTAMRRSHPRGRYLGFELELNQSLFVEVDRRARSIARILVESLEELGLHDSAFPRKVRARPSGG
jgi:predicted N-formylglutamate amidohydrolase